MKASAEERIRVAVVIPKYGLVGGGELFAFELTERLAADSRYDIHVLASQWQAGSERITFHKIPVFSFPKWLTTISFAWFVQRELKRLRPDIVHAHDRVFRADVATVHSIPHRTWVKEIRRKKIPSLFDLATSWVERKMFEKGGCRKVMPVSTLAAEKLCEVYPWLRSKVEVIAPGVDLARFGQEKPEWRAAIRQEFGIGNDDFLVLFVGMNFELKGLESLMRAVALAQHRLPGRRFSLLVVGRGDAAKFQGLAHELGIGARVFFAGVRRDMERVYQAGDVFCLLSQFDTFGMVVGEALAAGLPVVVSERVGAKDLVHCDANGYVVAGVNVDEIASALVRLADRDMLAPMRGAAVWSVAGQDWHGRAMRVGSIYTALAPGTPPDAPLA